MQQSSIRFGRSRSVVLSITIAALVVVALPAAGDPDVPVQSVLPYGFQGEHGQIEDADNREGSVAPSAAQRAAVDRLGASVRWNAFGTPHTLINHGGELATGYDGEAVEAARAFLRDEAELFGLTPERVDELDMIQDSPFYDSPDQGWESRGLDAPANPDVAHAVRFRQTFEGLNAAWDGMVVIGVTHDGRIVWAQSTLTGDDEVNTTSPDLDARTAWRTAAGDIGWDVPADDLDILDLDDGWDAFELADVSDVQRARLVAMPTPTDGVRLAWETVVIDGTPETGRHPLAFIHFIDATDGTVLFRSNRLNHFDAATSVLGQGDDDNGDDDGDPVAQWRTFPAYPTLVPLPTEGNLVEEGASVDDRERWCWEPGPDCDRIIGVDESTGFSNWASRETPWDVDPDTGQPTFTTRGNNADTAASALSPFTPDTTVDRPVALDRDYDFEWSNIWYESSCDPQAFSPTQQRNDLEAATATLNVGHNRMHDWGYYLGWTEINSNMQQSNFGETEVDPSREPPWRDRDPETGQSQAGYGTGTVNPIAGRDNANQITLQDGLPGVTNQYLWQPIASAIYVPCVDGAYDMGVVAHEVGHAIQHRMTAGPDTGMSGREAGSMGESWSDLTAVEYLNGLGFVPVEDENPYAVGAYVTGDPERGIRNYAMNDSPLNYSNLGYDFVGPQVHADGEIWSAANFALREALIDRYDDERPADDAELQEACAEGQLAADECPGNRVWVQLMHDGFLLQPSQVTMPEARDAMLAADEMRFDGANQDLLWQVFAEHGLGEDAESRGVTDDTPIPSFADPLADNATVTFDVSAADGGAEPERVQVFVGEFEARSRPIAGIAEIADDDGDGELQDVDFGDTAELAAGTYDFLVRADGFGGFRFTETFDAGEDTTLEIELPRNLASLHDGAEAVDGDGVNLDKLIDDTEATNWLSDESDGTDSEPDDVEGRQVTVALAGDGAQQVGRVQVSAQLRTTDGDDEDDEAQNRFSALRAFEILACNAEDGDDCEDSDAFDVVYTSPEDAFPSEALRPRVSDLTLRSFDLDEQVEATHVRLRVLTNQCTGVEQFQGDLDNDDTNNTDCRTEAGAGGLVEPQGENVRAAELQVFAEAADEPDFVACPRGIVPPAGFTDTDGNIHEFFIDCAAWYELTQGQTAETYAPGGQVTREQMASFIANTVLRAGFELPEPSDQGFEDLSGGVHDDRINQLAEVGLVEGTSATTYAPGDPVRRDQMASFIVNAYERVAEELPAADSPFDDTDGNTHEGAIGKAAAIGFTEGVTEESYEPGSSVRRDQMATFLTRVISEFFDDGRVTRPDQQ